jgi:uncharacterized repeat protein (TIGR04076 family)
MAGVSLHIQKRKTMTEKLVRKYGERVGYTETELERFQEGGHRIRQVSRLSRAAGKYSIKAEVVDSRNCNSGHIVGQTFILDVDGNFITKLCPSKMCVYLLSQLTIPVALINERLSEGLEPNDFHFMRFVRCPDSGVDCYGYGEVMLRVQVVPRVREKG